MAGLLDPQPQPYGLLGDIRQYTGAPSRAISGLLDWYQSQPSVADRMASEYQGGLSAMDAAGHGLPERLKALAAYKHANPETMSLAMDFGGMLGTMAGVNAKTANLAKLAEAQDLAKAGAPRETIWDKTGWFQGADKKWRFEIDDSSAKIRNVPNEYEGQWGDIMEHPAAYKAYGDLPNVHATYGQISGSSGAYGAIPGVAPESIAIGSESPRGTGLHEMQHAIQKREGFARGGSPTDPELRSILRSERARLESIAQDRLPELQAHRSAAIRPLMDSGMRADAARAAYRKQFPDLDKEYDTLVGAVADPGMFGSRAGYQRLAGEVEARSVQRRKDLTPEQRAARPPWLDYDVPEDQMIVRLLAP